MSAAIPLKSALKCSARFGNRVCQKVRRSVTFRTQNEVCYFDKEEQPDACGRYALSRIAGENLQELDALRGLAQIFRDQDAAYQQLRSNDAVNRNISLEPASFIEQPVCTRTALDRKRNPIKGNHSRANRATIRRVARAEREACERLETELVLHLHFLQSLPLPADDEAVPVSTSQARTSARESRFGPVNDLRTIHLLKAIQILDVCG